MLRVYVLKIRGFLNVERPPNWFYDVDFDQSFYLPVQSDELGFEGASVGFGGCFRARKQWGFF